MKTAPLLAAAASLAQAVNGLSLRPRQDGLKVVGLETERRAPRNPLHRDKLRRRGAVSAGLDNEATLYFINATVGTPGQPVRLHLDTGSSDLWLNTPKSTFCSSKKQPCAFAGAYTANSSSTYQYVGSYFNISYVDGSGASGDYVSDTVTVGEQKLNRLQFGVGYSSTNAQGILGIGYQLNEVQVGRAGLKPYNNLPAQMVADGLINSKAYSLWLNNLDANTGSILFGGVEPDKYEGTLQSLPVEPRSGPRSEFFITLTKLQLGGQTIGGDLALAVLLDTGSSLTYLPDPIVQQIYTAVGAVYDSAANAAYVPCSLGAANGNSPSPPPPLTFTFTSPTISVAMRELVLDLSTPDGRPATFADGTRACLFGVGPAGAGTNVLGDTFLRSAYVVYDLDNDMISLAPTRFNVNATTTTAAGTAASSSSRVLEIRSGSGGVPGASVVANPVRATDGLRGSKSGGGGGGGGGGGRSSSGGAADSAGFGAAAAAVAMALVAGVMALL